MIERIAVVDEDNRFLRWEPRRVIHEQRLPHRSVHILVFHPDGRLLIQRRHRDKDNYPHFWDSSGAGHVDEADYLGGPDDHLDQVHAVTAARELEEELGIVAELELIGRQAPRAGVHYEHCYVYRATSAGPYTPQLEEVEELRLVSPAELRLMIEDPEIPVTNMLAFFFDWLKRDDLWG